jgi:cytochrome c
MPELATETNVEQVLTGLQVGALGSEGSCSSCGGVLRDGRCVTVYTYQCAGNNEWESPRVYCRKCHPDHVRTPTLGTAEIVASAFLGVTQLAAAQTTRLSLTEVELRDYSSPSEGAEP